MASRGSTNKAFIRTDQTSAIVEVRLANVGELAYKPEVYGCSIRIERRVTNTSSAYRIMDDKGKVVVEKKHKEELERILMAFNIQVDNPIAVSTKTLPRCSCSNATLMHVPKNALYVMCPDNYSKVPLLSHLVSQKVPF